MRDFEKNMQRAARSANDNFGGIENRGRRMGRNLERDLASSTARVNTTLASMGKGIGNSLASIGARASAALGAVLSVNELKKYADTWTETANKIAAAGEAAENVGARQSELVDLAIRSRTEFGAVADLYTGLRRSTEELGASQAQVLQVTETISKGFAVNGTSATDAANSIRQLNQAFGMGKLSGDELNSVLEGAPPIARLIAKEFGVSVGKLKELAEAGKLTSDKVFTAVLKGAASIEAEFAKTNATIAQSFTNLSTAFTRYVGQMDQATGASRAISGALEGLTTHMDVAAPAAAVLAATLLGAFAGPVGAGIAGTATALALFGDKVRPISSDLATLGDYGRAAFAIIGDAAAGVAPQLQAGFQRAADLATAALSSIGDGDALPRLLEGVKAALNAVIGAFVAAVQTIRATWSTLGNAIAETIVNAMNAVVATVQAAVNRVVGAVNSITSAVNSAGGKVGIDVGLGKIPEVNLGQVANSYAGAGKVAGDAYGKAFEALSIDYVGSAIDAGAKGLEALRNKANLAAAQRIMSSPTNGGLNNGSLDAKLKAPKGDADGKGGKGGAEKANDFEKEVAALEKRTRALDSERAAVGRSAQEAAKAEASFRLLEAAKKANLPVTDELRGKIDSLATAYASAKVKLDEAEAAQRRVQETQRYLGDAMTDALGDLLVEGRDLASVFDSLAKSIAKAALQAVLMGSGPLAGLFGGAAPAGGGVGGILGKLLGFSEGGFTGAGGKYEPAGIVHKGEYVIPADVVKRLGVRNLEGLRRGYAAGGLVGGSAPSIPKANLGAGAGRGTVITVAPSITVQATGGTPEQNANLAGQVGQQVSQQVDAMVRGIMAQEMRAYSRPGGLFDHLRR